MIKGRNIKSINGVKEVEKSLKELDMKREIRRKELLSSALSVGGLVFLILVFAIWSKGGFFTPFNLTNLLNQCYTVTIASVGAAFVYASGSMDMSIGSVMSIAALVAAYTLRAGGNVLIAFFLACVTAIICSSVVSIIHVTLNVPIFIVSMCIMNICSGITAWAVSKSDIYINYANYSYLNSVWIKVLVLIGVIGMGYYLFYYTRLGRDAKALGGNAKAAGICGVRRKKTIILLFVVHAVCIAIAGFFSLLRTGSVSGSTGAGLNLNIMIAIVLGGFPLSGGAKAKLLGPVIGALTVTVLINGIQIVGLDPAYATAIKSILFLIVIKLTYDTSKGVLVN